MLKNILKKEDCAKCRICCFFDNYDLWEAPLISAKQKPEIEKKFGDVEYIAKGDSWMMKMGLDNSVGYFRCPVLDDRTGCLLGDGKPFDCRIWPFRVMRHGGVLCISVCRLCPSVMSKPLEDILKELEDGGLAKTILDYAVDNPDIIKNYEPGYPMLMVSEIADPMA